MDIPLDDGVSSPEVGVNDIPLEKSDEMGDSNFSFKKRVERVKRVEQVNFDSLKGEKRLCYDDGVPDVLYRRSV